MRIILSNHARMRAQQRGISIEQIIDCITQPDQISEEPNYIKCFKKLTDQEKSLLLCYTSNEDGSVLVITVIKTSKISKYLK